MYLHIGGDRVVLDRDIIGIFDIDNCSTGKRTKIFFSYNQKAGNVVDATDDLPKSFIVTSQKNKLFRHNQRHIKSEANINKVYISGVSPATLKKRSLAGGYSDIELEQERQPKDTERLWKII